VASDAPVTEISTQEFRSFLSTPGSWVGLSLGGLLFWALSVGLLHAHFFTDTNLGLDATQPLQVGGFGLLLLCWFVLGGVMIRSALVGILDFRCDTVQVLPITITGTTPGRHGTSLHHLDSGGKQQTIIVRSAWNVRQLPQEAELWRTRYGRLPLRLRLRGEGVTHSVPGGEGNQGSRG
jgi:hypothetical protein